MRLLMVLVITIFMGQNSFAAKWEKIDIQESSFVLLSDIKLYKSVYKLVDVKEGEDFINSLKQLTYIARAEFSTPEFVSVEPGTDELKSLKEDNTRTEPEELSELTYAAMVEFTMFNVFDLEIFEGSDGNTFGDCANVYLFEKKSQQVGLFSICYAE